MNIAEKMAGDWAGSNVAHEQNLKHLVSIVAERGRKEAVKKTDWYLRGTYQKAGVRAAIRKHKWEEEEA